MSFLGGLVGGIGGLLTGGPIGAVTGAITGSRSNPFAGPTTPTTFPESAGPSFFGPGGIFNPFQPGGFPGIPGVKGLVNTLTGNKRGRVAPINGRCPQGYHPCKKGGNCCRNRHMNFGNGRATSRSIRRIKGAERQFKHIFSITHPHKGGVRLKRKR